MDLSEFITEPSGIQKKLTSMARLKAEEVLFEIVGRSRHDFIRHVCDAFPTAIVDWGLLEESVLNSSLGKLVQNQVRQRLVIDLQKRDIIRRVEDSAVSNFQEFVASIVSFDKYDEFWFFQTLRGRLRKVIDTHVNCNELRDHLERNPLHWQGYTQVRVQLGTHATQRRSVQEKIDLSDTFCHNRVVHGQEVDRHVYSLFTAQDPMIRTARFHSAERPHEVYLSLEVPVVITFRGRDGHLVRVCLHLGLVIVTLVYPDNPYSRLTRDSFVNYALGDLLFPSISLEQYVVQFLACCGDACPRIMRTSIVFAVLSFMLEHNGDATELITWDPFVRTSTENVYLRVVSDQLMHATTSFQKGGTSINTRHLWDHDVLSEFRKQVRDLKDILAVYLVASDVLRAPDTLPSITYVSPYVLS